MTKEDEWFAFIDWASQKHQICLLDATGQLLGQREFAHSGTGLAELCNWLLAATGGQPAEIAVGIEVSHGPVVEALLERGLAAYALNPKQLDRFRDRFTLAGAKDDRRDAYVGAMALRTDRHCFHRLAVDNPLVIELRAWSRLTEELQQDRIRLTNRLRDQLWRYFPQMLQLTDDLAADWVLDLWLLAPTPDKARRLPLSRLARLFKQHGVRRLTPEAARSLLRQTPLAVAAGTTEATGAHIRSLIPRLQLANRQWRDAQRSLERLCNQLADEQEPQPGQAGEQNDVAILDSLPGIGTIVLATLLAEASEPLSRRDYHALRTLSGVAPVTRRSGKQVFVVRRLACHRRLRNALYHWARAAIQRDPRSRQRYDALRQRGHSHARALRTVADRLLAVLCAMLRSGTLYDPARNTQNGKDHPRVRPEDAPPPLRTRAVIGSPACTALPA